MLVYLYDEANSPIGFMYRESSYEKGKFDKYLFTKNLQGDIIGIYNESGVQIGYYNYNAWGQPCAYGSAENYQHIVEINPFRYRGYYFDQDTGFYYLNSRYYDSITNRFISADSISYLGVGDELQSFNLYSYCGNNPVMGYDPMGTWNWGKFFSGANLIAIGVAAIAVAVTVATCGTAGVAMLAVAAVTLVAGAATVVNGTAEIVEAGTDYNFMRDGVYGGDTEAYEQFRDTSSAIAEIGTMICGSYVAANGGNICFVAGTLVLAEAGKIAIENIEAGDYVWATNPDTNETELKQVVRTFENEATELVHVYANGQEIICTNEHPFYSPVKGWTAACKLKAGDMLVTVNGEYVIVEWVQHELLESPIKVYNFEVEDFHTYYVGDGDGVLVHNRCKPDTEVHHVVEQSQIKKSGFSNDLIQNPNNKVTLDYNVHRQISGYYSSNYPGTKIRVRDWLAGQSFEAQTKFGWEIIKKYRGF